MGGRNKHRDRKLLDAARDIPCQFDSYTGTGPCGMWADGSIVAAHSNNLEHGKGMGTKAHDVFIASACPSHHMEYDQGKKWTKGERKEQFRRAHDRTMLELFRRGIVGVV